MNQPRDFFARCFDRREFGVASMLIATIAIVSLINPAFFQIENLAGLLSNASAVVILASGMTLVIATGEIDISIGSTMCLCAAVLGLCVSPDHHGLPSCQGVLIALAIGAAVGLFNGLLVAVAEVPSIIVTLGMLSTVRGIALLTLGGNEITNFPDSLRRIGVGQIFGVPICVWIAAGFAILFSILTSATPIGRRIFAIGSNGRSARLAGISQIKIKLFVFITMGLLAGAAAVIDVARLGIVQSSFGSGMELLVVTCVVVGGASVSGGRGSVAGSVLSAVLLTAIGTELIFLKLPMGSSYWQRAVQGAFILAAILIDHAMQRRTRIATA